MCLSENINVKRILNDDPFINYGTIPQLFGGQLDLIKLIIKIIDIINGNGCYTSS